MSMLKKLYSKCIAYHAKKREQIKDEKMGLNLLPTLEESFRKYLTTNSRSNEKLKILHAKIASDLLSLLGDGYKVYSLGFETGKEHVINGRYVGKVVDITVADRAGRIVGGIAVKFVMSNYSQNSNNYFENMLGETANIRSANIPYFQILVIPDEVPYYKKDGSISKPEHLSGRNIEKYIKLSQDNPKNYLHTPDKTLLMVIALPRMDSCKPKIKNRVDYKNVYLKAEVGLSNKIAVSFGPAVILNNYDMFMNKIAHRIQSE